MFLRWLNKTREQRWASSWTDPSPRPPRWFFRLVRPHKVRAREKETKTARGMGNMSYSYRSVVGLFTFFSEAMKTELGVFGTHGLCHAGPTVTFPAKENSHCRLAIKLIFHPTEDRILSLSSYAAGQCYP